MEKFPHKTFLFQSSCEIKSFFLRCLSRISSLGLVVVVGLRMENWYSPTHTRDSGGNVTQKFPVAENSIYTLIIVSEFSCGWSCREGSRSSLNVDIYFNFSTESTQTLLGWSWNRQKIYHWLSLFHIFQSWHHIYRSQSCFCTTVNNSMSSTTSNWLRESTEPQQKYFYHKCIIYWVKMLWILVLFSMLLEWISRLILIYNMLPYSFREGEAGWKYTNLFWIASTRNRYMYERRKWIY